MSHILYTEKNYNIEVTIFFKEQQFSTQVFLSTLQNKANPRGQNFLNIPSFVLTDFTKLYKSDQDL